MDLSRPFRASDAVAAGVLTPAQVRGPRFRTLFSGIHVRAATPVTLELRAVAAALAVPHGVLAGHAAAEVLGASCGPADAPVELVVPGRRLRNRPGLTFRSDRLRPGEVWQKGAIRATSPVRTAFDLGRRPPITEAVVALDALARVRGFAPDQVLVLAVEHRGARGTAALPEVVRRADARSGSPMETRIRIAIVDGGLPVPVPQHPVGPYFLDLAYPELQLGIEYDGRDHLTPERALRDLDRQARLTAAGWVVLRFRAHVVLGRPQQIARDVARARLARIS